MTDSCFVFIFGPSGTLGALFGKDQLISSKFFNSGNEAENISAIENYILSNKRAGVKVVLDYQSQNFISRNASKSLGPSGLAKFLKAKLESDLKQFHGGMKTARLIKSDANEKTDEYLLSTISTEGESITFLKELQGHSNNVVGFYSSAAEINDISSPTEIKELSFLQLVQRSLQNSSSKKNKPKNTLYTYDASSRTGTTPSDGKINSRSWIITISFLETSGLRTTVSIGSSILISKVKKISDRSFNETAPIIVAEINSVISYAERASLMPRSSLFMNVFGSRDFLSTIEAVAPDVGTVNLFLMQDYINATKNQALAKEYNHPASLALAYKVYKKPFMHFVDDSIKDNALKDLGFKVILYVGIAIFIGFNSYAVYKIIPLKNIKAKYATSLVEQTEMKRKLDEIKGSVQDVNIDRVVEISKFYAASSKANYFTEMFTDVSAMLNVIDDISVSKFTFEITDDVPTISVSIAFNNQSKQAFIIDSLREQNPSYNIMINDAEQNSNETLLRFFKK